MIPLSHLILCHPFLLLSSIFPSIRVFSKESALYIRWPKYWSFNFNISTSKEYPGLISFRMDFLDLFAIQGTLKSPLQHHSSKASILYHSAFFIVQLSHPYMTTGKTIALTWRTFVDKGQRQIWLWSIEWSRAKADRVLPRERTGHSKHPLPITQEKTLHMDITRWSTPKSDWLYSLQPKMEKLYTVSKNKTGSWLWLRAWTPYCQIQT